MVRVHAPARLHFGFLDLHGGLGRRFGSIGVAVDAPSIDLTVAAAPDLAVEADGAALAPERERIRRYAEAAARQIGVPAAGAFRLRAGIPAHAGFGSGTQLALSVAAGLAALHGAAFAPAAFADALDRGNRSGVGLAAFVTGGLIVDGGRDAGGAPPPIVARLPYRRRGGSCSCSIRPRPGCTGRRSGTRSRPCRASRPGRRPRSAASC